MLVLDQLELEGDFRGITIRQVSLIRGHQAGTNCVHATLHCEVLGGRYLLRIGSCNEALNGWLMIVCRHSAWIVLILPIDPLFAISHGVAMESGFIGNQHAVLSLTAMVFEPLIGMDVSEGSDRIGKGDMGRAREQNGIAIGTDEQRAGGLWRKNMVNDALSLQRLVVGRKDNAFRVDQVCFSVVMTIDLQRFTQIWLGRPGEPVCVGRVRVSELGAAIAVHGHPVHCEIGRGGRGSHLP